MGAEAHKQAVEQAVELWNAHDQRYFDVYSEDAVMHGFPPDVPPNVDGIRGLFTQMWSSLGDARVAIKHIVAESDLVAVHLVLTGTHDAELMGAPPSGNPIEVDILTLIRLGADGKIEERWTRMDEVAFLTQLGLMPAPAAAPA